MSGIDWQAFLFGLTTGTAASTLFFAGLALSMRMALRAARTGTILLLSAGLRIALLIAVGWFVAKAGSWAFVGYTLAFLLVRMIAVSVARPRPAPGERRWN